MDNISLNTTLKLKSVGFSYPEYEHFLNIGMCYYYLDSEYLIGGSCSGNFSSMDAEVACNGIWLPNESQLLEWLRKTEFDVTINWNSDDKYFNLCAIDRINGQQYVAGGIDLPNGLAKVIYKICKSHRRAYVPEETLRIQLEN